MDPQSVEASLHYNRAPIVEKSKKKSYDDEKYSKQCNCVKYAITVFYVNVCSTIMYF